MSPRLQRPAPLYVCIIVLLAGPCLGLSCARRRMIQAGAFVYHPGDALTISGRVVVPRGCPWVGEVSIRMEPLEPSWGLEGAGRTIRFADEAPALWPSHWKPPARGWLFAESLPLTMKVSGWLVKHVDDARGPRMSEEVFRTRGYRITARVPTGFAVEPASLVVRRPAADLRFRVMAGRASRAR